MNKNFKVMSKTALAAIIASAAIVPVMAAPAAAAVVPVSDVVYDVNGQNTSLELPTFTSATNAGVLTNLDIKYVKAGTGEFFSFSDFTSALNAFDGDTEKAITALKDSNKDVTVPNVVTGTVDPGTGAVVPDTTTEDFEVTDIAAINKTSVNVTLKDTPSEAPTANDFKLTVNGADLPVTEIAKVESDLTGKTYKVSYASLNGKQGSFAVNGTDAGLLTGSEYAFDFKAPTVTEVVAKGNQTVEVTFSEKMAAGTVNAANIKLAKTTTIGVDNAITSAVLSTDGKKATLTLTNPLTVADYTVTFGENPQDKLVKDVAGNAVYGGTEVNFKPTSEQLTQAAPPTILSAQYDNARAELNVMFNKEVTSVDATKLSINGVTLTSSDSVTIDSTDKNRIKVKLSAATKEAVNALTGELTLTAAAEAFTDGTDATEGATQVISKVTPAVVSSSAYNEETDTLTVKFDQPVKIAALANIKVSDRAGIAVADATGAKVDGKDLQTVDKQTASATWELKLTKTEANKLQATGVNKDNLKVYLDEAAVQTGLDSAPITNAATTYATGQKVVYTADVTAPVITNVEFTQTKDNTIAGNDAEGTLTITFNEDVKAFDNPTNVKIATSATGDTKEFTLNLSDGTLDKNKVTFDTTALTSTNVNNLVAQYQSGKTSKVFFDEKIFKDTNDLENKEVKFVDGIAVTIKDFVKPIVGDLKTAEQDNTHVVLAFDEPMDKASAENKANYSIVDSTGTALEVTGVQLLNNKKSVLITTAAQENLKPYTMTVKNVKDVAGNIADTKDNLTFTGKAAADVVEVGLDEASSAAQIVKNAEDTIVVKFDKAVDSAKASAIANYKLFEKNVDDANKLTKPVSLNGATVVLNSDQTEATISLGNTNLQNAADYKLTVNNITDVYGNAMDVDASSIELTAAGKAAADQALAKPTGIAQVKNNKGVVELTFDEALVKNKAEDVSNYTIDTATGKVETAVYSFDAETNKSKVTLTLKSDTVIADVVNVAVDPKVVNLAGISLVGPAATITVPVADLVAPEFAAVDPIVATANTGVTGDTVVLKFNKAIADNSISQLESNYVVTVNGVALDSTKDYTVSDVTGNEVELTLDAEKANILKGDTVAVTAKNIRDTAGNTLAEATVSTTEVVTADADGEIATTLFTASNEVTLTFNDNLQASSIQAGDFAIKGGSNFVNAVEVTDENTVVLTLAAPVYTGTVTIVKGSEYEIKDDMGNVLEAVKLFAANGLETDAALDVAPVAKNVKVTADTETMKVGTVLTGTYAYSDANGDDEAITTFKWYADGDAIGSATSDTFTVTAAQIGKTISFEVTPVAATGSNLTGTPVKSTATEKVLSNVATLTSDIGTVSTGGTSTETITDVTADTTKEDFIAALTLSDDKASINTDGLNDTIADNDTVVVTAEDGTEVTYTITVASSVIYNVSNLTNFNSAVVNAENGDTINVDLTGFNANPIKLVEPLGKTLTVNLTGATNNNVEVDMSGATVNNNATGTFTITDVSGNTWNENVSYNTIVFNDPDAGTNFVIGAGQTVTSLTLNTPATVTVPSGAAVTTLTVEAGAAKTTIANAGTIATLTSKAPEVVLTGEGVITTPVTEGDGTLVDDKGEAAFSNEEIDDAAVNAKKADNEFLNSLYATRNAAESAIKALATKETLATTDIEWDGARATVTLNTGKAEFIFTDITEVKTEEIQAKKNADDVAIKEKQATPGDFLTKTYETKMLAEEAIKALATNGTLASTTISWTESAATVTLNDATTVEFVFTDVTEVKTTEAEGALTAFLKTAIEFTYSDKDPAGGNYKLLSELKVEGNVVTADVLADTEAITAISEKAGIIEKHTADQTGKDLMSYSTDVYVMNTLSRYLGALNAQSGVEIKEIKFKDETYTWVAPTDLKGSNWKDLQNESKTLVSAIVDSTGELRSVRDINFTIFDANGYSIDVNFVANAPKTTMIDAE